MHVTTDRYTTQCMWARRSTSRQPLTLKPRDRWCKVNGTCHSRATFLVTHLRTYYICHRHGKCLQQQRHRIVTVLCHLTYDPINRLKVESPQLAIITRNFCRALTLAMRHCWTTETVKEAWTFALHQTTSLLHATRHNLLLSRPIKPGSTHKIPAYTALFRKSLGRFPKSH